MTRDAEKTPPAGILRRGLRRVWRGLLRLGIVSGLLLLGAAAYLQTQPVPGWAQRRLTEYLARRGIHIDAAQWRISWTGEAEATGFRWYDSGLREVPVIEADRFVVRVGVHPFGDRRIWLRDVTIRDGLVRVPPGGTVHGTPQDQVLVLKEIDGFVEADDHEWRIGALRASVLGLRIDIRGVVNRHASAPRPAEPATSRSETPAWLRDVLATQFDGDGSLLLQVDWPAGGLPAASVTVRGGGAGVSVRGVDFDEWHVDASLADGEVEVSRLSVQKNSNTLEFHGRYRLEDQWAQARIESSLPGPVLLGLLPEPWAEQASAHQVFPTGGVTARFDLGPAPLKELAHTARGRLDLRETSLRGVWFDEAGADIRLTDTDVHLSDAHANLGHPPHQGRVSGDFSWAFDTRRYRGTLVTRLDFYALRPILDNPLTELVHRFEFHADPPEADVEISGQLGNADEFILRADAAGSNLVYLGTSVERAAVGVEIRDRRIRIDPLRAERLDGTLDGWILIDPVRARVDFQAVNTAPPDLVACAIADQLNDVIQAFSWDGPTRTDVAGSIAFRAGETTDVHASVTAEQLGVGPFVVEAASFDVHWAGTSLRVANIQAATYGGDVEGTFEYLFRPPGQGPALWALDARARRISFEDVARALAHEEGEPYRGRLDALVSVAGESGDGLKDSLAGEGNVRVTDGRILMIPLFGGLSRMLSWLYPGLGFSQQSDFYAKFTMRGPEVRMRDVRLEGDLFSLNGKGSYDLVDQGLDYDVEFQLLREGAVGTLIRFVTRPITKLLEFDLEGTLQDPEWRPKNLPKEIFVGFEEE